jgi:predicted transcriptional regulator/transcriptional regulator with XRE-family HTH domain
MTDIPALGVKVKTVRRRAGLTQAQLANKLDISASYLNLIENDKRPLTAPVLLRLCQTLELALDDFAPDEDARLSTDLVEAFSDPLFEDEPLTNQDVRELVTAAPTAARAVMKMYRALRASREQLTAIAAHAANVDDVEVTAPRALTPSEDVSDFLQKHDNHFPEVEALAEKLWTDGELTFELLYARMVAYLKNELGVTVSIVDEQSPLRRYDAARHELRLSELLPPRSRNFQLAHQIGLLLGDKLFTELTSTSELSSETSKRLGKVALANYFSAAVLMPYEPFLEGAEENRYDIELLGHRFRTSFEQVAHRLTTMRRPGREGIPFHFVRVDVAGNISKRFSGSGIQFARYSGACPRWNVFHAFLTPGQIRTQLSRMPDGTSYFCMARTVRTSGAGYHSPVATYAIGVGCPVEHAHKLVYADGVDLDTERAAVPVGVTCRLCDRMDCPQRAFPTITTPLEVDENQRGASFYAPRSRG